MKLYITPFILINLNRLLLWNVTATCPYKSSTQENKLIDVTADARSGEEDARNSITFHLQRCGCPRTLTVNKTKVSKNQCTILSNDQIILVKVIFFFIPYEIIVNLCIAFEQIELDKENNLNKPCYTFFLQDDAEVLYSETTCGRDAFQRGGQQGLMGYRY